MRIKMWKCTVKRIVRVTDIFYYKKERIFHFSIFMCFFLSKNVSFKNPRASSFHVVYLKQYGREREKGIYLKKKKNPEEMV